jgi:hypothetical protein
MTMNARTVWLTKWFVTKEEELAVDINNYDVAMLVIAIGGLVLIVIQTWVTIKQGKNNKK